MSYREQEIIALVDMKYFIYDLVQIYKEGKIHFLPVTKEKSEDKKLISDSIGAIQRGIPMPVIYASELQNGDLLILEPESWLLYLLEYIMGDFSVFVERTMQEKHICYFYELDEYNPRLTSMIMNAAVLVRIIDYHTPKYLHIEVGLFHEKWNLSQEQAFRDVLYDEQYINDLRYFRDKITSIIPKQLIFEAVYPIDEYIVLCMLLFWGIYTDAFWFEKGMGEQELLDVIMSRLDKNDHVWHTFWETFQSCTINHFIPMSAFGGMSFSHNAVNDKNIKCRARMLGFFICFYDMAYVRYAGVLADIFNYKMVKKINSMRMTLDDIVSILEFGKDQFR